MASSNIAYCTDRDLSDVMPSISEFDLKTRIINWQTTGTSNLFIARNSGLVTQLFSDGEDLGDAEANSGVVNANGEWYYDSDLDTVYYFDSATNPNDRIMETGDDWATIKTRFRKRASRLIESMIDYRIAGEIWKDREGNYPQIVVHATALLAVMLSIKAHDPNNEILESLKEDWTHYSWWSCYAENDDYPWHHHANMFFTSCWFIHHDEKHAPLSFRNPLHSILNGCVPGDSKLKNEIVIKPEQGDLLIWPGWLEHEVPGPDAYIFYNKMEQGANKWQYDPDTIKYDQLRITLTCNLGKLHDSLTTTTREAI